MQMAARAGSRQQCDGRWFIAMYSLVVTFKAEIINAQNCGGLRFQHGLEGQLVSAAVPYDGGVFCKPSHITSHSRFSVVCTVVNDVAILERLVDSTVRLAQSLGTKRLRKHCLSCSPANSKGQQKL